MSPHGCSPVSRLTEASRDNNTPSQCRARVTVANKLGLHIRPSRKVAAVASSWSANIEIINGDRNAMADSQLDLLMLLASKGAELEIVATGDDAEAAVAALVELFERKFDED